MTKGNQYTIRVPAHVKNASGYIRAAEARIAHNRRVGNRKRWEERSPEGSKRCYDFLMQTGEFEPSYFRYLDENYKTTTPVTAEEFYTDNNFQYEYGQKVHSWVEVSRSEFFSKMYDAILEHGALTEGQEAAVLKMIKQAEEKIAARKAAKEAKAATSNYVGKIGERQEFVLSVVMSTSFEGEYGTTYIYVMNDEAGNEIVHKGSMLYDNATNIAAKKGHKVTLKATVKAHKERDGIKQTIINRPKLSKLEVIG